MKQLDLLNGPVRFDGAISLEPVAEGVQPWRLDFRDRELLDAGLQESARVPAGVRITFRSDTRSLALGISNPDSVHASVDLVLDGALHQTIRLTAPPRHALRFDDLRAGEKRIEIYLPTFGQTVIHDLAIDDGASIAARDDRRVRWSTYGSSLTMCRRAASPTRAWPAMVASEFGWNLTALGFGGQCCFDPVVARTMAKQPADVLSVCLGINTLSAYSARTWLPAVTGFLLTLRDAMPTVPLLVFSPMYSGPRETTPSGTGLTLVRMRQWLAELVGTLRERGDSHIAYVDGLEVFGQADAHMMPDQLHPEADGIELMAQRIAYLFRRELPALGVGMLLPKSWIDAN